MRQLEMLIGIWCSTIICLHRIHNYMLIQKCYWISCFLEQAVVIVKSLGCLCCFWPAIHCNLIPISDKSVSASKVRR